MPDSSQTAKHFQQINRALRMLSDCIQTLVRARAESQLLREMCRIIVEVGGYRLAWIGYKENDAQKSVRPVAQAGYEEGYLETLKITWADTERGRGPTGTAIRTGQPATCQNMLTDPKFKPWRKEALKRGYQSSLVLPLLMGDQILGAISIYAPEPDSFGTEEFNLLAELADNLVFGIMALRNRAELDRSREALEEKVNERTRELSHTNEVLRKEIRERERAEADLRNSERELAIRNRIKEIFLTVPDDQVFDQVLAVIQEALASPLGTFGYIREDGAMVVPSMTRAEVWDQCQVAGKDTVFPSETWGGLWKRALLEKRSFRSSGPFHYPPGHVLVHHYLTTPILFQGEAIGIINVGNKTEGYTEEDQFLLENIALTIAPVLQARLERDQRECARKGAEAALRRSEANLQAMLDAMPVGVILVRPAGEVLYANPRYQAETGFSLQELQAGGALQVWPDPADRKRVVAPLARGERLSNVEATLRRKDGSLFPALMNAQPIEFGGQECILGSMLDITARKRAEEAGRKAAEEWHRTFDAMPDLIMLLDPEHRIVRVNQALAKAVGHSYTDLVGRHCFRCIHGTEAPIASCPHARTLRDGQEHIEEVFEPGLDRHFLVSTTPLRNEQGILTGSVHVMRDITERKQAEETIRRALAESRRREEEIQALLDASRAVLEYREFKDAARSIFDSCKNLLGAKAGYVALLTPDGMENEVLFLDAGGMPCSVDSSLPMPIRGLREVAYRTGETVYENDFSRSRWTEFLPAGHVRLENVLFKPLVIEGKAMGLLGLANKPGGFTDHDAHLATAFGKLAAVALQNSRTLESLEHSEERFRNVAHTATDAIISVDAESKVIFWNPRAEQMFGYPAREALGRPLPFILPERFRPAHEAAMARAKTEGPGRPISRTVESFGLRRSGDEFPCELSIASWKTGEGVFFTGMIRDISERRRAEKAIRESEKKYRTLYESSADGVVSTDLEGQILDANQAYLDMIGYTLAEARQLTYQQLTPAKWHEAEAEIVQHQILARGYSDEYEKEYIRGDGTVFPISLRVWLIRDEAGRPQGMWGIFRDITERKQAEEELRRHHEHLEELVESRTAEVHQVIKDLQGEIAERKRAEEKLRQSEASLAEAQRMAHLGNWDWNILTNELIWSDEIYRIFGLTPREFGATYDAFLNSVHPEDRALVTRAVDEALYQNQPYSLEHRIVSPAGEVRVVQEQAEITFDPVGKPIRMIGTVQDITERKRAEAARDKAEAELEEQRARAIYADRLRSLGEMAAGIAHELNQPLLGVRGLAEHILIGADRGWDVSPDKIKEKVNLIVEQSDRMSHIIEGVRMFARGADNSELMPVQVNEVIRSGTGLIGAQTRARGMILECELMENLPEVLANPFSLEEVVLNLLTNARDATAERRQQEPGSVPPRILLRTRAEPEGDRSRVVIDVVDQGAGIPPEIMGRLFDPFFTTKAPEKGTGLGLPISKSIVEGIGGQILIQSSPGVGTTVTVSLPALKPGPG